MSLCALRLETKQGLYHNRFNFLVGLLMEKVMNTTLGKEGLNKTWQAKFPETTKCCRCKGESRIGFVAHEGMDDDDRPEYPRDHIQFVTDLHENKGEGGYWPHDCVAVAVYFCRECLNPTALYNQG